MTAQVVQIRDYHLRRLERRAQEIISQVIDYAEIARVGGPIVEGAIPCELPHYMDREPA